MKHGREVSRGEHSFEQFGAFLVIFHLRVAEIFLEPFPNFVGEWRMSTDEGLHHQLSSDQNVPNVVYGSSWSGAGAGDGILMLACIWRQSVIQFTMARYSRPH